MPGREAGSENGETGMQGGEGKTTFTTARSATSITAGWVDSVCRCHEDSVEHGRERRLRHRRGRERERKRETSRAKWGHWGVLSGLQSVTMVTPHH